MKRPGILLLCAVLAVTVLLWIFAKVDGGAVGIVRSLAQLSALLAATLAVLNYVLAARARTIERLFGGLDKMYMVHRLVGGGAFLFMLYHPIFLAVNVLPNWSLALRYFIPGGNLAYTLGIIALALFIVLIVLTIFVRLPYHFWKRTHILMGIPLVFVGFHTFIVPSDASSFWPLTAWMALLFAAAGMAVVYKRFLYTRFGPRFSYTIRGVVQLGAVTEIQLVPHGAPLSFLPGQFVFVSFLSARLSPEKHPFTISSSPSSPELRLSVKNLGDWTSGLAALSLGTDAVVYGPYGVFGERAFRGTQDQVWIAGGIGITPFLGIAAARANAPETRGVAHLFYCTKTKEEAVYLRELEDIAARTKTFRVTSHVSDEKGFITAERVLAIAGVPADGLRALPVFLCGPKPMTDGLIEQLEALGVGGKNIIREDFSFFS
jgi:predicted ferric reductase